MHTVDKVGSKFIVVKDGQIIADGFNFFCEAQERADELNGGCNA